VIQEEGSVFWEVIVQRIVRKNFIAMCMCNSEWLMGYSSNIQGDSGGRVCVLGIAV